MLNNNKFDDNSLLDKKRLLNLYAKNFNLLESKAVAISQKESRNSSDIKNFIRITNQQLQIIQQVNELFAYEIRKKEINSLASEIDQLITEIFIEDMEEEERGPKELEFKNNLRKIVDEYL